MRQVSFNIEVRLDAFTLFNQQDDPQTLITAEPIGPSAVISRRTGERRHLRLRSPERRPRRGHTPGDRRDPQLSSDTEPGPMDTEPGPLHGL